MIPSTPAAAEATTRTLEDCQSCRQCAIHCPEDAVYVSLLAEPIANPDREAIIASGRQGKLPPKGCGKRRISNFFEKLDISSCYYSTNLIDFMYLTPFPL